MLGRWPTPEPLRQPSRPGDDASNSEPRSIEALPDQPAGEWLRAARARRNIGIDEVARDTRINQSYLEAIEGGHFEELPAPVYARGFVRMYARYLGLDPELAVARMPSDLPRPEGLDPLPGLRRSAGEGATLPLPSLPLMPAALASLDRRWLLGGVAAVLLLLVLLVGRACADGGDEDGSVLPTTTAPAEGIAPSARGGGEAVAPSAGGTVPPFERGRVPNFAGVTRQQAEGVLRDLALTSVIVEIATAETPAGQVIGQTPPAGASVKEGDNVTLVVSRGPPRN